MPSGPPPAGGLSAVAAKGIATRHGRAERAEAHGSARCTLAGHPAAHRAHP